MIYICYILEEISMKENIDVPRMRNTWTQPTTLYLCGKYSPWECRLNSNQNSLTTLLGRTKLGMIVFFLNVVEG